MTGSNAPIVSVVIPVHTTPPDFFREAVESVRAQTETRWELVIVLDAASSDCLEVAREMARQDARIRVVGEGVAKPRGSSAARNLGVQHSRASCVAFLDSDDVFEPSHIERLMARLEAHPEAGMVYGSTLYWHSWSGNGTLRDHVPALGVRPGVHSPPDLVASFINGAAAVPCTCSLVVRRAAFDAVGGFDEIFRDLYDDQVFYARVALRMPVVVDDAVLDRYRQHPDSMTAKAARGHELEARTRFLEWLENEIARVRWDDAILRRAIASERWKLRHPAFARVVRLVRRAMMRAAGTDSGTNPHST